MIYLDHNATSPMLPDVLTHMLPWFSDKAGNPSSIHGAGRAARLGLDTARRQVAHALGVRESQIIFTSGGSEANNLAILGMAGQAGWRGRVITSQIEHPSVLQVCQRLEQRGMIVVRLPVNPQGEVEPHTLAAALTPDTVLATLMHANNETGVLQPITQLAALCREQGVPLHTDAVQSVGKIPVTMSQLGVSLLSLSAHKFGGPKGMGALVVDSALTLEPQISGGGQERGRRAGTENIPAAVGLGTALTLSQQRMVQEIPRLAGLRHHLEAQIHHTLPQCLILGESAPRLPNTTALLLPGLDGETLVMALDLAGFAVSSGSACSSGKVAASHVATAMGHAGPQGSGLIRISLGWNTTATELERFVPALAKAAAKLAAMSGLSGWQQ